MFDLIKRKLLGNKPAVAPAPSELVFSDGASALEYACKFMDCTLAEGAFLPAVVVDSREFGANAAVVVAAAGQQRLTLRVASRDGGFIINSETVGTNGPRLKPGDFVAWWADSYSQPLADAMNDTRRGWIGLVIGTLKPEYRNGSWVGGERFS
jgi:hypothetical protein